MIVPDQIGFDESSEPDVDCSFEAIARNTLALADALSLGRITVPGHSTGGALAVRLATMAPERVEQLVLEDPIGLVDYRAYIAPQETETLVKARMPGIHQAAQEAMGEPGAARFVSLPDVGHVPHLEMPDRFKSDLLAFLKS
ncbi:alpha/beta hydrolase [Methylobacterium sp. WL1]|uniref:alpha/beta fold hydrolase n=1 Tax=Methylobacterium sp. WL1 TaxID=2603276 RepID=UPI0011C1EFD3|nr:alpha/beta hydrolase [Methylobacterium sp. WL1]QEE39123.1 alpha/beta fold hydrolase [Methylobacterium sp. WL1]TXN55617.1 alpha/beta fold hydrolase [Methylobacterium sp. WL2]